MSSCVRLKISGAIAVLILIFAGGGIAAWSLNPYNADPAAYRAALSRSGVVIEGRKGSITIRPVASHSNTGLLFYPGLHVAPESYLNKLTQISEAADIQIVIGRPRLNVAALSIRQADEMRQVLPGVKRWYVGGHSMGGAMACLYASWYPESLEGVMLWGTYCGVNISKLPLRVLSVSGANDGVFPPVKIRDARSELPRSADMIQVPGMNHAQFGNYGPQSGDSPTAISDETAGKALSEAARDFFSSR